MSTWRSLHEAASCVLSSVIVIQQPVTSPQTPALPPGVS
jgi:hypothetical protein